MQIVGIKEIEDKMKQTRYRVQVTDGVESIYCMMSTTSAAHFKAKEMIVGSVISITNYQISIKHRQSKSADFVMMNCHLNQSSFNSC